MTATADPIAAAPWETVGGRRVLFAMAAEAEYGAHLKARIRPLITGIGPVEAAVALTAALGRLDGRNGIDLVVSLGSAGSATLQQTAVYQVASVSYRDMDASALGFKKGVTPLLDLPATLPLPIRIPGIPEARLSTGAAVISGAAYGDVDADMVDMETFAVLRACQHFGVPLIGLRGISDGAEELRHVGDWTAYLHVVDENLAAALDRLQAALASGEIAID